MALIKCPECGKEISDKSKQCIHCGYPLIDSSPNSKLVPPNNKLYGVRGIKYGWIIGKPRQFLNHIQSNNRIITGIKDIDVFATGITEDRAKLLVDFLIKYGANGEIFEDTQSKEINQKIMILIDNSLNEKVSLKCPRCGSDQIVTGQRGFSLMTGFIGANKTINRCAKCGHSWQPK